MKTKHYALGLFLVLGTLGAPNLGADSKDASTRMEAALSKTAVVKKTENQKERNKKLLDGMTRLAQRIDGILKKSPDFSGS